MPDSQTPIGAAAPSSSTGETSEHDTTDEKRTNNFVIHIDPNNPSTNAITAAPDAANPLLSSPSPADTLALLQTFQTALGIPASSTENTYHVVSALSGSPLSITPRTTEQAENGPNPYKDHPIIVTSEDTGLYSAVCHAEDRTRWNYRWYRFILSTCLLLQILLGAVLTAMGAAKASHIAITVVSAISTVVAGTLALMKGQGLPNRCRSDMMGWKSVRKYIEEREGEIAAGMYTGPFMEGKGDGEYGKMNFGGGLEAVWREVRVIEGMYKDVGRTVDGNRPDSYVHLPGWSEKGWTGKNM